jgi:hypothetical protein
MQMNLESVLHLEITYRNSEVFVIQIFPLVLPKANSVGTNNLNGVLSEKVVLDMEYLR